MNVTEPTTAISNCLLFSPDGKSIISGKQKYVSYFSSWVPVGWFCGRVVWLRKGLFIN